MTNIVIQGICGRMGHVLVDMIAQRNDCQVIGGIDPAGCSNLPCPVYRSCNELAKQAIRPDVIIDFSHPDALPPLLAYCTAHHVPCVICTTGLSDTLRAQMDTAAKETAVFYSANMSLGINLLASLVKQMQTVLPGFDIEIIEKHHHNKLDAPSGTALLLADSINEQAEGKYHYVYDRQQKREKRDPNEIGLHAVRGGSIVGEHEVLFAGPDEVISISHTAYSRDVFASGAIAAAVYVAGKPAGTYTMQDLMQDATVQDDAQ